MAHNMIRRLSVFIIGLLLAIHGAGQEDDNIPQLLEFNDNQVDEQKKIEQLKQSIRIDSTNTQLLLSLGAIWESQMQYDSAAVVYQKSVDLDSTCIPCHHRLAGVMASKGMVKLAIGQYNKTIELDSMNISARSQMARLLKRENNFREALDHFYWLITNDSTNFYLWEQVGDCSMRIDSVANAIGAYSISFQLNSANMPLAVKLINGYMQSGIPPMFIFPVAHTALQHDSTYVPIVRATGYLHFLSQDYKNSEDWFTKAYNLKDSTRFTFKFLGISKYHNGSFTNSANFLEKAFAMDTTDVALNFVLAKSLIEIGERQRAIDVLNLTERILTPDNYEMAMIYSTRADSYIRSSKNNEAIAELTMALKFTPDQHDFVYEIAMCYYRLKELNNARESFIEYINKAESKAETRTKKNKISSAKHFLQKIEKDLFFKDELHKKN
jgi:tetratricopeptide (TPR) repeat protein